MIGKYTVRRARCELDKSKIDAFPFRIRYILSQGEFLALASLGGCCVQTHAHVYLDDAGGDARKRIDAPWIPGLTAATNYTQQKHLSPAACPSTREITVKISTNSRSLFPSLSLGFASDVAHRVRRSWGSGSIPRYWQTYCLIPGQNKWQYIFRSCAARGLISPSLPLFSSWTSLPLSQSFALASSRALIAALSSILPASGGFKDLPGG